MHQCWQSCRSTWRRMGELLWLGVKEVWTCRECRGPAGPFDKVCSTCGAAHPVNFPISTSMMTTVLISLAVLVLMRLS